MKYVKMLGLLALAAAALMAFAGTASATVVTSPAGTPYTGSLSGASEGGHVALTGPLGISVECAGSLGGKVNNHGPAITASGPVETFTINNCTNGYVVHVKKLGTIESHAIGGGNATITSSNATVEITNTPVGTCSYTTSNTDLGKLTGGTPATIDISSVLPRHAGSSFCGSTGTLEGSAVVTSPGTLIVD